MGGAITALLAAALAAVDGTAVETNASVRAQTSAHAYAADGVGTRSLVAEDVLPNVSLLLDHHELKLTLRYEPQLRLTRDPASPEEQAAFVQGGSVRGEWDVDPAWKATGDVRAAERLVDLGAPGAGPQLLDLRVTTADVRYVNGGAALALEGRLSPVLTLRARASVDDTGGVAPADRLVLPRMQELRLASGLARAQSPKDTLGLDLAALDATVDGGAEATILTAGLGWTRAWTRTFHVRLAASASEGRGPNAPGGRLFPGGALELESTALAGRRVRLAAALRAGPAVDRYGALVEERVGADAALGWALAPRWTVEASAGAGRVVEAEGYSAARGDARAVWRASRRLSLSAGAWTEWHHDPKVAVGADSFVRGASAAVEISTLPR